MESVKYIFFYGGPLSNWYPAKFELLGIKFSGVEQWMMWCKAMLFRDTEMASRILQASTPNQHKSLGRIVKGFNSKVWDKYKLAIVHAGVLTKFQQNDPLRKFILGYDVDVEFVEASPTDLIWGIGLSLDSSEKYDPLQWRGQNLLGKCLNRVRKELTNS